MAAIVDFYSETNKSAATPLFSGSGIGIGQSFTGNSGILNNCKFYLFKAGSPTGNAVAKIYTHTGTFGTSSKPTGSALATSDVFDVSTLTGAYQLITFNFTGNDKIALTNGTHYVVTLEYDDGDGGNYLAIGYDNTSPTHPGNMSGTTDYIDWWSDNSYDLCFYVYKDDTVTAKASIQKSSTQTITSKGKIQITEEFTQIITSKAKIVCITKPVLITPISLTIENSPVYFVWEIPTCCKNRNMHAHIQIDKTDNTFGDLEKDLSSYRDSNFEYWDGGAWQPYPIAGVTSVYYGNQARVQVILTNGDKYWKVKGEVK